MAGVIDWYRPEADIINVSCRGVRLNLWVTSITQVREVLASPDRLVQVAVVCGGTRLMSVLSRLGEACR